MCMTCFEKWAVFKSLVAFCCAGWCLGIRRRLVKALTYSTVRIELASIIPHLLKPNQSEFWSLLMKVKFLVCFFTPIHYWLRRQSFWRLFNIRFHIHVYGDQSFFFDPFLYHATEKASQQLNWLILFAALQKVHQPFEGEGRCEYEIDRSNCNDLCSNWRDLWDLGGRCEIDVCQCVSKMSKWCICTWLWLFNCLFCVWVAHPPFNTYQSLS